MENKLQSRKKVKGLLLFYYKNLYSVSHMNDHVILGQTFYSSMLIFDSKFLLRFLLSCTLCIYFTFPSILLYFDYIEPIINTDLTLVVPVIFAVISWVIVRYVLASEKLIERISQYEEVIVADLIDKQSCIKRFNLIFFLFMFLSTNTMVFFGAIIYLQ